MRLAERMAGVPKNQLMMQKLIVNQAIDKLGLEQTPGPESMAEAYLRPPKKGARSRWSKKKAR